MLAMNVTDAGKLAIDLMNQHGLLAQGWHFQWIRSKRTLGRCHHGSKFISLSKPYVTLNEVAVIQDTILHEIAHALAGGLAGHGPVWKAKAIELGARPVRKKTPGELGLVVPAGPWSATCAHCGATHTRYRQPKFQLSCSIKYACRASPLQWTYNSQRREAA